MACATTDSTPRPPSLSLLISCGLTHGAGRLHRRPPQTLLSELGEGRSEEVATESYGPPALWDNPSAAGGGVRGAGEKKEHGRCCVRPRATVRLSGALSLFRFSLPLLLGGRSYSFPPQ
ncbi:hypothetical protein SKAU_G00170690 [Synaphobranchus kaupii]|uniref:Uncharacterized protein n=1 Tax=Synaphobranchus kaupii TaxID=118154 RepID=A0A9Q1FKC6_SYNKA|nr:hypothetical protein SKAU_G00170690 [Synaphobranchus kaupii]